MKKIYFLGLIVLALSCDQLIEETQETISLESIIVGKTLYIQNYRTIVGGQVTDYYGITKYEFERNGEVTVTIRGGRTCVKPEFKSQFIDEYFVQDDILTIGNNDHYYSGLTGENIDDIRYYKIGQNFMYVSCTTIVARK